MRISLEDLLRIRYETLPFNQDFDGPLPPPCLFNVNAAIHRDAPRLHDHVVVD
jgi:hypothetical protein